MEMKMKVKLLLIIIGVLFAFSGCAMSVNAQDDSEFFAVTLMYKTRIKTVDMPYENKVYRCTIKTEDNLIFDDRALTDKDTGLILTSIAFSADEYHIRCWIDQRPYISTVFLDFKGSGPQIFSGYIEVDIDKQPFKQYVPNIYNGQ